MEYATIYAGPRKTDMTAVETLTVSGILQTLFVLARAKNPHLAQAWVDVSYRLTGRFALIPAVLDLQRLGDIDLVLRAIEDEQAAKIAITNVEHNTPDFSLHYQMTFSQVWVLGFYEVLRLVRQRDKDARRNSLESSGISDLAEYESLFRDFEVLRMPLAKYEIAKDNKMKHPLKLYAYPKNSNPTDERIYDKKDPSRHIIMPTGLSARGSVQWLPVDHTSSSQRWIERQDLSDRFFKFALAIEPAGIREARLRAEKEKSGSN